MYQYEMFHFSGMVLAQNNTKGMGSFKEPRFNTMKERDKATTFLGKGTQFERKLTFHGAIRIDGHFRGEISADGILIVGEGGIIEANIHVYDIIISGEIHGSIIADHRIEIHPPAKVFGDIQAHTIVTHEGITFEGICQIHPFSYPILSYPQGPKSSPFLH